MSAENPPKLSTKNNTLEFLNQERVRILKENLEEHATELSIPEPALVRYLSDVNPDLLEDIYLLGPPEKLMPTVLETEANKNNILYLSPEAGECEDREEMLTRLGASEGNAIAAMRSVLLFAGLKDHMSPAQTDALAIQMMGQTLAERAIFLAGKYDLELPPEWTKIAPRERIGHLLLDGVQDPTIGIRGDELPPQDSGIAKTISGLYVSALTDALAELFKKHPDPGAFACELLDTATLRDLLNSPKGEEKQTSLD